MIYLKNKILDITSLDKNLKNGLVKVHAKISEDPSILQFLHPVRKSLGYIEDNLQSVWPVYVKTLENKVLEQVLQLVWLKPDCPFQKYCSDLFSESLKTIYEHRKRETVFQFEVLLFGKLSLKKSYISITGAHKFKVNTCNIWH